MLHIPEHGPGLAFRCVDAAAESFKRVRRASLYQRIRDRIADIGRHHFDGADRGCINIVPGRNTFHPDRLPITFAAARHRPSGSNRI